MTDEALPVPVHRLQLFKGFAAAAAVVVVWSGFNIVSRLGGRSPLTPYDMAAIRFVFSGIVCLPFVLARWRRLAWQRLAVLAAFGGRALDAFPGAREARRGGGLGGTGAAPGHGRPNGQGNQQQQAHRGGETEVTQALAAAVGLRNVVQGNIMTSRPI